MPFTMKIQPIDIDSPELARVESSGKPVLKSRLKRLFDRPFTRNTTSSAAAVAVVTGATGTEVHGNAVTEFEPSSVCLAKMVQNFIEENNDKQQANKCGRNRCNCFNGNNESSSSDDDELDLFCDLAADSFNGGSPCDASDHLKRLIPCASIAERNLLAETAKIVDKNKSIKRKDDLRKIVNEGLLSLNYDSSICKSKWEKTSSFPSGEYEYIDVVIGEERLLIDVDFRSEFDIARQTSRYKALLQSLPFIFVGKSDRLSQIVSLISEAAKQSLKKRGMYLPPWRKAEYMRSRWLSSYTRVSGNGNAEEPQATAETAVTEVELIFEEKALSPVVKYSSASSFKFSDDVAKPTVEREVKAVTGLALLFKEKP